MSVSIEGSGSITGVSTFNNATFSGITTFADNINFDANIAGVTTFLGVGVTSLNVLGVSTFTGQLNAGTISATTLSATTVSIAGTLTYQDVTNIDSVGIITARSGINVTGGNVGIGTDNSLQKLHLFDTTSANIYLQTHNAGTGSTAGVYFRTSDSSTEDGFFKTAIVLEDDGTSWARGKLHILQDNTADASNATLDDSVVTITQSGSVGVSSSTPKTDVDISQKTGAVALPQGTTAQRPTGSAPYIRKNTTNNALEYFDGTSWVEIITDYFPTGSTIFG